MFTLDIYYTNTTLTSNKNRGSGFENRTRRTEGQPLQELAFAKDGIGGLTLTRLGGKDFVCGFVAGAPESAPHVPTGNGAVRAPTLAEGEEFLGLGHVFLAVGDGPAFLDA